MLNLYQLQIFQTVALAGSFSRAAERLYLSQPAVSQHIQTLESDLGVRLFKRGRRGITLTPSGEILTDYAQCLTRLAEETRDAVTRVEKLAQPQQINIGANPEAGIYLLPNWIRTFHQRHPALTISLKTAITPTIIQAINDNEIQIGIVEGDLDDDGTIQWTPLWSEDIVVITPPNHPWGNIDRVDISALAQEPLVVREKGSPTRAWEMQVLSQNNVIPQIIAEFDSPAAIKQAVASGLGVAMLPYFAVAPECNTQQLHAVRFTNTSLSRPINLMWAKGSLANQAVHAFISHLSQEFPHLPLQILADSDKIELLNRLKSTRRGSANSLAANMAS
ncbi:MAG: LysR family transcriptional regulator [Chloroflexi bacterium]|nr:MAG: LysR family transcriptional regulator [Chloroflexota bacterium]